ncbi:Adenosylcobinamide amidohydrolase [Thalassovita gelatinovora]|uniref:Adenosylcobinamide amidohydrolase n=1 Tax=Thalassovita gelatinovora TaxID=53501 RepID=A0A0P1FHB0_THAGE|nr:adenosylcobinamide amidohydrolase [Thalassovita gelatinovora]QIZ81941.1 adenosylcobinamide amidohydrolase [Thalassovita gelatinovora]CUH67331.1 Adenosylcobinamide amidohydrolase [Thalassovita gelatinovora]SEP76189.1 adenosylcobinamide hydrolase [Thalassovita gelatinovora]
MSAVNLISPWLSFDLGRDMQVLSWAINRPGFVTARRIVWREVRNADLPRDMDVADWFGRELATYGFEDSVAFLTSRDVTSYADITTRVGDTTVQCIATVGLSNAERVGARVDRRAQDWGTINLAVRVDCGLTQTGLIETLSIATQARTAAVMDADVPLPSGRATGTGTDCIAIAAPSGSLDYAGLHTELGEAVGAAVYGATLSGALQWKTDIAAVQKRINGNV